MTRQSVLAGRFTQAYFVNAPCAVHAHVWCQRALSFANSKTSREADSRSFYDSQKFLFEAFDVDWCQIDVCCTSMTARSGTMCCRSRA